MLTMSWLQFVVILYLITITENRLLTTEENEKRLEDCGKNVKSKIFNGRKTDKEEAPWAVKVFTVTSIEKDGIYKNGICSGTLLSPRHILTATHCSATANDIEWTKTNISFKFDREECQEHENVIVTEVPASKVYVTLRNESEVIGRAKFMFLFKFCRKITDKDAYRIQYPDDLMIVELSEDVEYSSQLQPACLARDIDDNAAGTELDFYGYGDNPPPGVAETHHSSKKNDLLYHKIKVLEINIEGTLNRMDPRLFIARSAGANSVICPGDSGGGAIGNIDGRNTVVGVAMRTTCVFMNRDVNAEETFASAGFYAEDICEFTGICTPPRDSASGTNWTLLIFITFFLAFFRQ